MRFLYALWSRNSCGLRRRSLKWGPLPPIRSAWKATWQSRSSIPSADEERRRGSLAATQDPLKLYVRQIGRRAPAHPCRGARARPPQGRGRRGGEEPADRVQPPARDVDHPPLHPRRRAAARPDPGGQPRPHPRGREVRLHARLQALDLRDLVDPPGDLTRARRAGPHDPPARPRRRPGAPGHAGAPDARTEAQPRPVRRRDRRRRRLHARTRSRAARARAGPRLARHADRRRRERDAAT